MPSDLIIDDSTPVDRLLPGDKGRGAVPRDYGVHPFGATPGLVLMKAVNIPIIPKNDRYEMAKELKAKGARLSDIRRRGNFGKPIPAMDQGRSNFCWAHSTTMGVMLARAKMGLPYVPLSAFAVAATIKNGANEGGWGALSAQFAERYGIPSQQFWPQGDYNPRSHNTPEMQANAALHKLTSPVVDLADPVYSRNLSDDQIETLLLNGCPVVADYMFWEHSVLLMDLEPMPNGVLDRRGLNSWGDSWGDLGEFVLSGDRKRPDGAVGIIATTASLA